MKIRIFYNQIMRKIKNKKMIMIYKMKIHKIIKKMKINNNKTNNNNDGFYVYIII